MLSRTTTFSCLAGAGERGFRRSGRVSNRRCRRSTRQGAAAWPQAPSAAAVVAARPRAARIRSSEIAAAVFFFFGAADRKGEEDADDHGPRQATRFVQIGLTCDLSRRRASLRAGSRTIRARHGAARARRTRVNGAQFSSELVAGRGGTRTSSDLDRADDGASPSRASGASPWEGPAARSHAAIETITPRHESTVAPGH